MEITWLGDNQLLLRGKQTRVLLDPPAGRSKASQPAEIVVTARGGENILRPENGPQVVALPGEYELKGVSVVGVAVSDGTVFVTEVDDVAVCNFGDLPARLQEEQIDSLGNIDVLTVSLEPGSPQRALEAAQLVSRLQPAVVVPVGYRAQGEGMPDQLAAFAKEMGVTQFSPQAKLTLTGSAGGGDETRVVLLEARG